MNNSIDNHTLNHSLGLVRNMIFPGIAGDWFYPRAVIIVDGAVSFNTSSRLDVSFSDTILHL